MKRNKQNSSYWAIDILTTLCWNSSVQPQDALNGFESKTTFPQPLSYETRAASLNSKSVCSLSTGCLSRQQLMNFFLPTRNYVILQPPLPPPIILNHHISYEWNFLVALSTNYRILIAYNRIKILQCFQLVRRTDLYFIWSF